MASSSPPHNPSFFFQRINSVDSCSSAATTKERTNTADSTKEGFLLDNNNIISPSHSKDDDFSSVEDDAGRRQDSQINDDVAEQRHEEYSNLEASDPLLMEALAPGESSSPTATGSTINNNSKGLAGRKFDLCGSMYKRRGGFGRNAENNWVMRSFTLYGHILCYHEESQIEQITDPSKPRARLNLAKTETIAEMHSKHKIGLPTDHLLTINIYDAAIRNKRKWEMCCTSKEQQLMWYNAIRVYDGPPVSMIRSLWTESGGGSGGSGAWSPTPHHNDEALLPNVDSSINLFSTSKASPPKTHRISSIEVDVLTKAAVKAVELWMEKEKEEEKNNGRNKKSKENDGLSRNMMVLLFVTMNVALHFVRNGSDQTFHATLFFVNAFVLYLVLERTTTAITSKTTSKEVHIKERPKAKVEKRKVTETEGVGVVGGMKSLGSVEIQQPLLKMMLGTTIPRSLPKIGEFEMKFQNFGANSEEAVRAFASAPMESIQVHPHSYGQVFAPTFNLRIGPNYKKNKQKGPSGPALYDLFSMDFLYDSTALKNVSDKFRIPSIPGVTDIATGHAHIPPMLVINTWLPGEEPSMFAKSNTAEDDTYSIPMVFVLSKDTLEQLKDIDNASPGVKLLSEWCRRAELEPEFRGRFKCMGMIEDIEKTSIPKFIHGYNGKPALVTKSGTFTRHENYIEFSINVNYWAFLARKGLHTLIPYFQDFIFNVGFTIEARSDEEMPEVLLGGCRIMNLDPEKAAVDE